MVTLKRIETQVNNYTGPWQAGYKSGRSCADLVWCQRMLLSVVQQRQWDYHRMGIDMSSAFDTINRHTILRLLADAGCTNDEIRFVRVLLSNTKLRVRVNGSFSAWFMSTNGSFQGDCLSGCLFTLTLAGALNHLRIVIRFIPDLPISENSMPLEAEYADDVDFNNEDEQTLRNMLPIVTEVLREWSLYVNEDKTEFTHIYLADPDERTPNGEKVRANKLEPWRNSVTLGSMLCSIKDIQRRITLANAAFATFKKVWLQGPKIPLSKKLIIYEAQVVSVLLYNSGCWAAPLNIIEKIDTCHRKHLRRILNLHWPFGVINNKTLYKRCNTTKLSDRIALSRWTLFGHILRMPENSPAHLALHFALDSTKSFGRRRGNHQINLLGTLRKDIEERDIKLRIALKEVRGHDRVEEEMLTFTNVVDLGKIRDIAKVRSLWNRLF